MATQGDTKPVIETKVLTSCITPASGIEVKSQYAYIQGNIAYVNIRLYRSTAFSARTTVGNLVSDLRPIGQIYRGVAAMASAYDNRLDGNCEFYISGGAVTLDVNSYTSGKEVNIVCAYAV